MKVAGFSFIRNAIKYDYPIIEAIQSIMPICDDIYIAVGKSDDNTLELIKNIAPQKIHIIETEWDDSLREGGKVLAVETNKALASIPNKYDWAFYIQGDEVLHEQYNDEIQSKMQNTPTTKPLTDYFLSTGISTARTNTREQQRGGTEKK